MIHHRFSTIRILFVIVCTLIFYGSLEFKCIAQELIIDADRQFEFAEHLFASQKYQRAIDEYERFIFFFLNDRRVTRARYRIALSYDKTGNYSKCVDTLEASVNALEKKGLSGDRSTADAFFLMSECYLKQFQTVSAISVLNHVRFVHDQPDIVDEAFYRTGWIHIESGNPHAANQYFKKISSKNRSKYHVDQVLKGLETAANLEMKNPTLAGLLSILPGAGYVYCGRYQDALVSFVINGILIGAAIESFDKDLHVLGGLISCVEIGFYSGNIYGSVNSTRKYNRQQKEDWTENLKKNLKLKISGTNGMRGGQIALCYDF